MAKEKRFNILNIALIVLLLGAIVFVSVRWYDANKKAKVLKEQADTYRKRYMESIIEYNYSIDSLEHVIADQDSLIKNKKERVVYLREDYHKVDTIPSLDAYKSLQQKYSDYAGAFEFPFTGSQVQSIDYDIKKYEKLKPLYKESRKLAQELEYQVWNKDRMIGLIGDQMEVYDSLYSNVMDENKMLEVEVETKSKWNTIWKTTTGVLVVVGVVLAIE